MNDNDKTFIVSMLFTIVVVLMMFWVYTCKIDELERGIKIELQNQDERIENLCEKDPNVEMNIKKLIILYKNLKKGLANCEECCRNKKE